MFIQVCVMYLCKPNNLQTKTIHYKCLGTGGLNCTLITVWVRYRGNQDYNKNRSSHTKYADRTSGHSTLRTHYIRWPGCTGSPSHICTFTTQLLWCSSDNENLILYMKMLYGAIFLKNFLSPVSAQNIQFEGFLKGW